MKVRVFLKSSFLLNWTFLKILCLIGGKRDEDAFASTTWFRGAIFFGKLSWDCEEVVDRQTDRLSKLAKSWNCLVRGALACSTSSPSSSLLHSCLHCCAVCCSVCCCCRLCCWWCWWESQGRRVERLTTSCLHRHQPDHCHHPRHRLVTVLRSRPRRGEQYKYI